MTREERIFDNGLSRGMDTEFLRIEREIKELLATRNKNSSHGRAQIYILKELLQKIDWEGTIE